MNPDPASLLGALAETTRLRIVHLLVRQGELCVCDLVGILQIHQPKISRHLAILRNAGIIRGRREGTWIHYRIDPQIPTWASQAIRHMLEGCDGAPYRDDLLRLNAESRVSCK